MAHGKRWLVKLDGINNRNDAEKWCHCKIGIRRCELPDITDEIYWCDLIGRQVNNKSNQHLGEVIGLIESVNHDILEVQNPLQILLIPYHSQYIINVNNNDDAPIEVDWEIDW